MINSKNLSNCHSIGFQELHLHPGWARDLHQAPHNTRLFLLREKESLPALGWGMVSVLVVYLGAFLVTGLILAGAIFFGIVTLGELAWVILSVGFSSMGLFLAGFGLLVSYGSKLVVAYLVGKLLLNWLAPKYEGSAFWPLAIGVLIYTFLRAIPFGFGLVISVIVTLIGLGAMWLYYKDYRDQNITNSTEN
jgi:hypothetical protein